MNDLVLAIRLLLAAVFGVAGCAKLAQGNGRRAVADFGVPRALVTPVAILLPLAELLVTLALLATATASAGAIGALALLGLFMAGTAMNLAGGRRPKCQCFGQTGATPLGGKTLARDAVLAVMAAIVVARGPGTGLARWFSRLSGLDWLMLVVAIALVVAFIIEGAPLIDHRRRARR
ncbi:MAG TPA: MauE/DoxX family redox-associated membrane protein [Acidimicrobiales bacterium]|nr:MauE/DoxX family redox-associated membrane protein [Acidimicrobiales bacterium]